MVNLTDEDLIGLNLEIQRQYRIKAGVEKRGLLNSVVERPDQVYMNKIPFPDIYTKAASIFEALARWHVFSDLNKRTALIATRTYMDLNDYFFLVPLNAVRFSVMIARDKNQDNNHTEKLILKIAKWIKKYSAQKDNFYELNELLSTSNRLISVPLFFHRWKLYPLLKFWFNRALATDVHPEYKMTMVESVNFIIRMHNESLDEIVRMINEVKNRK